MKGTAAIISDKAQEEKNKQRLLGLPGQMMQGNSLQLNNPGLACQATVSNRLFGEPIFLDFLLSLLLTSRKTPRFI